MSCIYRPSSVELTDLPLERFPDNCPSVQGVIFLYRSSETKAGGVSRQTYQALQKLLGCQSFENVTLVRPLCDSSVADDSREEAYFKPLIEKGAELKQHDGTREGALLIINELLEAL